MDKQCLTCKQSFQFSDQEQAFYRKVSPVLHNQRYLLPDALDCPDCRQKRRLRFRNGLNLYGRHCDKCAKDIISVYPKDTSYPVYCPECWWGDGWDATSYQIDINTLSPFENIKNLLQKVPVLSLINTNSENSTYAHDAENNKNCYLIFSSIGSQDSMYMVDSNKMRNSLDAYWSIDCELCYEVISCSECYNTAYSTHSYRLSFSYFCNFCGNCSNCFGCFNIANKEYHIFNQPYTKEEYEAKIAIYKKRMETFAGCEEVKKEVAAFFATQPHQGSVVTLCENSKGDFLVHSKNCNECYNVVDSEDCGYLYDCVTMKDAYDCNLACRSELMYNCQSCQGQNTICSSFSANCSNILYSDHCFNCNNCFGCVGLRRKEYCIFNKQYTQEQYEQLVPQLIQQLANTNQWGRFFPDSIAPIDLRDSVIHNHFPLPQQKRIELSLQELAPIPPPLGPKVTCALCHKDFLMIKQELDFYRKQQLPLPAICFACRQQRRLEERNLRHLLERQCAQCKQTLLSTYPINDPTIIYCESCYQQIKI